MPQTQCLPGQSKARVAAVNPLIASTNSDQYLIEVDTAQMDSSDRVTHMKED